MHYALTTATEPVSLDEAKAHLSVIHDADDALIGGYISAARETVERHTGLALVSAAYTWEPKSDDLPLRPATVMYTDGVVTGFETTAVPLPAGLRSAILLIVGDLYASREANIVGTIVSVSPTVQMLIYPHRINLGV